MSVVLIRLLQLKTLGNADSERPAGSLGRQLQSVRELMRTGSELRMAIELETVRSVLVDQQRLGRRSGAILLVADA